MLKAIKAIERKHHCEKHGRACVLTDAGACYQLTNGDIAKWAKLMVSHVPYLLHPLSLCDGRPTFRLLLTIPLMSSTYRT